jgi:hypothetical protein
VSDPLPGFSSGLRYEKQCVQIVFLAFYAPLMLLSPEIRYELGLPGDWILQLA